MLILLSSLILNMSFAEYGTASSGTSAPQPQVAEPTVSIPLSELQQLSQRKPASQKVKKELSVEEQNQLNISSQLERLREEQAGSSGETQLERLQSEQRN